MSDVTTVDVLPPATRLGVPGTVICSEGYRRMQELDGKRRETTIYTGSARRKVTAPYVQCGVDSILRPALFVVVVSSVGYVCRSCVCVSSRSRDPCPPLYSSGEAGVLVGYKVEILVGLRVTSPNRITCRES